MNNNSIVIDSDKIDILVGRTSDMSRCIENSVDLSRRSFSSLQESSHLSQGVNTLNDNLSIVVDKFNRYKDIIAKQGESFFEEEKLLSSVAKDIEIPTELAVVDNFFETDTDEIKLVKEDGKSINTNNTNITGEYDNSTDINNEGIRNINITKEVEQTNYDDSTRIKYEQLNQINNVEDIKNTEYDDSSSINAESLTNINNKVEQTMTSYDDSSSINYEKVERINDEDESFEGDRYDN